MTRAARAASRPRSAQSERFGTKIFSETVTRVDTTVRPFKVYTSEKEARGARRRGAATRARSCTPSARVTRARPHAPRAAHRRAARVQVTADSLIIATGAVAKRLEFPGAGEGPGGYWNKGISACAVCDGAAPIFRDRPLAVIGGGDSAMEEASFLTKYGSMVYLIHRRGEFRASKIMAARALANPKIKVLWHSAVDAALGDGSTLKSLRIKNLQSGDVTELEARSHPHRTPRAATPGLMR